ncbi:hypothetical protein C7M84_006327 [Penaeus vannamei]|uniref:Fibronectin type-III domain-containing protein n=1 Tax=Penaeus vannamei TaxID=6689 RepID=A0A423TFB0_PENVA|nr:hypothetical protein C7M84_006327 [Penaeus vannamei]
MFTDVIVEPGRPVGPLLVSDVTNTSVTLSWNPPEYLGGGTLTCYIIEARLITCADIIKNIEIADADQTTYVVDNLETNKVYVFRVYAENETGMGDALILRTPVRVKEFIVSRPKTLRPEDPALTSGLARMVARMVDVPCPFPPRSPSAPCSLSPGGPAGRLRWHLNWHPYPGLLSLVPPVNVATARSCSRSGDVAVV